MEHLDISSKLGCVYMRKFDYKAQKVRPRTQIVSTTEMFVASFFLI